MFRDAQNLFFSSCFLLNTPSSTGPFFLRIKCFSVLAESTSAKAQQPLALSRQTQWEPSHKAHPLSPLLWEWVVSEREIKDFEDKI